MGLEGKTERERASATEIVKEREGLIERESVVSVRRSDK